MVHLDKRQILLKVNLVNLYHFLSIVNQINNNNIQFTIEQSQIRLPFLDAMISKSGTKIWM